MKTRNIMALLVLASSIILPSIGCAADLVSTVNDLQNSFYDAVSSWVGPLQQVAAWLLMTLATISFVWQASFMLLRGTDIQELMVELVRMVLFTGFFYWLIQNAPDLTSRLINGWVWLAGEAGGTSTSPNIGQILARGVDLAGAMYEASSGFTVVVAGILGIILVFLYVLIAAKAFLVTLEMYTVTAAGVILLGFGGNQWTGDYARRYITYTMATGMKLFVMYLIVSTGDNFINAWAADSKPETFNDMLSVVGVVLLMLVLVWQLPDIVQGLLSGASLGGAERMGGAAVMGTGQMLGGAMAGAAMGAAGGTLALREALKNSEGMPGSDAGFQYKAMNAMGNLAEAGAETLGNRIMGDYNASSGGFAASMAQHMRQKRTGGSGLYGGTAAGNDHTGGSGSGGSFGAGSSATKGNDAVPGVGNGADSSMQTVAEYAENAGYASPAGGMGVDPSGGSSDPDDNPATRYRSPAVDLTKGGAPSYQGYGPGAAGLSGGNAGSSLAQGAGNLRTDADDPAYGSGAGGLGSGAVPAGMTGTTKNEGGSRVGASSVAAGGADGSLAGSPVSSLRTNTDDPALGVTAVGAAVGGTSSAPSSGAVPATNPTDFDEAPIGQSGIVGGSSPAGLRTDADDPSVYGGSSVGATKGNAGVSAAKPQGKALSVKPKVRGVMQDTDAAGDGDKG